MGALRSLGTVQAGLWSQGLVGLGSVGVRGASGPGKVQRIGIHEDLGFVGAENPDREVTAKVCWALPLGSCAVRTGAGPLGV
jgi:hypothetical protein